MNQRIDCSKIKIGVIFSAPVYFDDGKNMFLAKHCPAKAYHLMALKRWKVPYLISEGHEIKPEDIKKGVTSFTSFSEAVKQINTEEKKVAAKPAVNPAESAAISTETVSISPDFFDDVEELEELEELEEV